MPRRRAGELLTRRQELAIASLLTCPTLALAAAAAGTSVATLDRWLRDPAFRRAYREARARANDLAVGSLVSRLTEALDCLERNMQCGQPASEIKAAVSILDLVLRNRLAFELEERVEELERGSARGL